MKSAVAELGAIGRNLNQIARAMNQGQRVAGPGREELRAMLQVGGALRDHVKSLLAANCKELGPGACRNGSLIYRVFRSSISPPTRDGDRGIAIGCHLAEVQQIARTVQRTPEVMVKVLSRGGQDLGAVRRHLDYLRLRDDGELELETDDGQRLSGEAVSKDLLKDWDLDLEEHRRQSDLDARRSRSPKLVHKLMFSMPAGTPPEKVLAAVKNFAREEFWGQHRYAMVLHTDEPHPHVHMVLKAVSEQGVRLNIKKATLRRWRSEFARNLRAARG